MAFEAGKEVILAVGDPNNASPTDFQNVAGQQDTSWVPDTVTDDITDKTNTGWESTLQVLHAGVINCSGKVNWPDTNGLDRVRAAWQDLLDIEAQITLASTGQKYFGNFQVTAFSIEGPVRGATGYSFTLRSSDAITYAAT
jgi:TP901-1 family phage major tail protein